MSIPSDELAPVAASEIAGLSSAEAVFAVGGILMSPLPIWIIASLVATTILFSLAMDSIKLVVFAHIRID